MKQQLSFEGGLPAPLRYRQYVAFSGPRRAAVAWQTTSWISRHSVAHVLSATCRGRVIKVTHGREPRREGLCFRADPADFFSRVPTGGFKARTASRPISVPSTYTGTPWGTPRECLAVTNLVMLHGQDHASRNLVHSRNPIDSSPVAPLQPTSALTHT